MLILPDTDGAYRVSSHIHALCEDVQVQDQGIKIFHQGAWVAQLVERLLWAQVMIPDFQDRVPHRAPSSLGSLLLPLTFSSLMLSLTHSLSNK